MKIELDLSRELTPKELQSFKKQAAIANRTPQKHAGVLLFGNRELNTPAQLKGEKGSNKATKQK